jgi:hypothetical protein
MDTESSLAALWLFVGIAVPLVLIYIAVLMVGYEIKNTVDLLITSTALLGSLAWLTYSTWQIRVVSIGADIDLSES